MKATLRAWLVLMICASAVSSVRAQSVACPVIDFTAGSTLTLPCGPAPGCTPLTATLPDIRNTASYTIDSIPYSGHFPFNIPGSTAVSVGTDDVYSPVVSLPFPFCYYGTSYNSCTIGSNGILSFNTAQAGGFCAYTVGTTGLPSTAYDLNAIFACFHDMDPSVPATNKAIEYILTGTAPCRQLIVNFRNVRQYNCNTLQSTFQLVLYENTNVIEVYIRDKPSCATFNGGRAIIGLHNANGTAATVIPGKNATVWGSTGMDKAYRFIPNGTSLLQNVQLLSAVGGTVLGTGTTVVSGPGQLTATFTNVCVNDSAKFVAKASYIPCSGTALTATDTIQVVLPPAPVAPVALSPISYCQGGTAVPLTATGTGLLWYTVPVGGIGIAVAPTPSTAVAGADTFWVSQTVGGCQSPRTPVIINVSPPVTQTITASLCTGDTLVFGGTTITTAGTYTDTLSTAAGCDSVVALQVSLTPQPAAPVVTTPVTYCQGAAATPLTAPGTGLLWYTTPVGGTGTATAPTPSTAAAGSTTWYVSQVTGGCRSARAAITVDVVAPPVVAITPATSSICAGASQTLTASGANTYTWSPAAGLNTTSGTTVIATPGGTTTYTVTGTTTGAAACSSTASALVTIRPKPAVGAASNSPVCTGDTIVLTGTGPAGTTYAWTGPGNFSSTAQNPTLSSATAAMSGTYTLTATLAGCDSSASVQVAVLPPPAAPLVASPITYCQGAAAVPLTATGTGLLWFTTAVGGAGSATAPTPSTAAVGSTTWYVSQNVGSCVSLRASITVNVIVGPIVSITPAASSICAGSSQTLTASGATTYTWSPAVGLNTTSGSTVVASPAITTTYIVTGTTTGSAACSSTASAIVTIKPKPAVSAASNSPVCAGDTIVFTGTATGGSTFAWTGPGGFTSALQSPTRGPSTAAMSGTYTVTATLAGCDSSAAVQVVVSPLPQAPTVTTPVTYCQGAPAIALTAGGSNLLWYTNSVGGFGSTTAPIPPTATVGSTTYYVSQSVGGCQSPRASIVVTVVAPPVISVSPASPSICAGTSQTLTAAGASTYTWSPAAGLNTTSGATVIATPGGTTTYLITGTTTGAAVCSSTASVMVTVRPKPSVGAASNSPVCTGDLIAFTGTATTGSTFAWSGPAAFSSALQNPTRGPATVAMSGVYTLTASLAGCDSSASVQVAVLPLPAAPVTTSPVVYCIGATATPLTAAGANLLWYTTPTGGTGSTAAPTPVTTALGSVTYYVSQTTGGCESPRAAITVNIITTPVVSVTPAAPSICTGASQTLTASGATTYTWSPALGLNTTSGATVIASPINTTTYTVTGATSGSAACSGTASVTVTIKPKPAVGAASNSPVCTGDTIALVGTAPAGSTFSWTGPGGFSSTAQNPTRGPATAAMSGAYSITATLDGCDSSATIQVAVLPTPTTNITASICAGASYLFNDLAQTTSGTYRDTLSTSAGCDSFIVLQLTVKPPVPAPTAPSPLIYCQGIPAPALVAVGTSLLWYTTPTGGTGTSTAPVPSTAAIGTTIYYVSQTLNGCESPRTPVTVDVLLTLPLPVVVSPLTYCKGAGASPLQATGTALLWYLSATGGTGSTTAPTPSTQAVGTTTYYVTQTVAGCESPRAAITVTVNPVPVAQIYANGSPACITDTSLISALSAGSGATYTWNFGPDVTVLSGASEGPYAVTWSRLGAHPITLIVERQGCRDTAMLTVPVEGAPMGEFLLPDQACEGEEVRLTAGEIVGYLPGFGYTWSFDGATIKSGAAGGPFTLVWNSPGQKVVSLIINGQRCSSQPVYDTILVHALPQASIETPGRNDVCAGDTMTFAAANASALHAYRWSPAEFFKQDTGAVVRGRVYKEGAVVLTVRSAAGCAATDSVYIDTHPCCEVMIPTAFSPNGDGRNDRFRALAQGYHHPYELRVFNRWGQVMFMSQDQSDGWDGRFNGVSQEAGVYFYRIRYTCADGQVMDKQGDVTLIR